MEYCSILSALGLVYQWMMSEHKPRCEIFVNIDYLVLINEVTIGKRNR